ncbi:hypothetical protein ACTXIU_16610 [Glutamicibacter arilaitensis]|uniref:hypothetical protein n=1 Tax=Glutamicibacter arilaitensis TaxID=256701 RepID=UPI003FD12CF7
MTINLDELRKIAEAPDVRPGPWHVYDRGIGYEVHDENDYELTGGMRETFDKADAEHIATFDPPTVLALITRLEQAEQDRVKLRNRLDAMRRQRDGYQNQLRGAEQQVARVQELREGQLCGHCADEVQDALEGELE